MNKCFLKLGLSAMLFCLLAIPMGIAQETKQKDKGQIKETKTMKELQGTVTWIGKNRIALAYGVDVTGQVENEILLPFDKDIKLVHKGAINQISVGDTVSIQYEEKTQEGSGETKVFRKAKAIIFIRAAVKKPVSTEPQSSVLSSEPN